MPIPISQIPSTCYGDRENHVPYGAKRRAPEAPARTRTPAALHAVERKLDAGGQIELFDALDGEDEPVGAAVGILWLAGTAIALVEKRRDELLRVLLLKSSRSRALIPNLKGLRRELAAERA